jgi:formate hydrogenlyase subunit 3/multisubunit Na+/H+ antiporter MnhD subunit
MNGLAPLLLLLTIAVPLAALVLVPLLTRPLRLLPWAALPGLATALLAPIGTRFELSLLLIGISVELDATAVLFLGFGSLLWLLAGFFATAYLRNSHNPQLFSAFWLLTLTGTLGTFIAADIAGFYLFFAMMSLAAYGLVIHERTESARRAGRIYIVLAVLGESALIAAFMLAATGATTLAFADVRAAMSDSAASSWVLAGLVLGFGIKAGLVPLHVWLPLAHPQAPTPASAVLSGVIVKAGIIGFMRLLPDAGVWPVASAALVAVGLFTAGYGVLIGLLQRDAKAILAYSTLSQMGLVVSVIGAALAATTRESHYAAVTLYVVHHGLAKGALFLGIGVLAAIGGRWRAPVLAALGVTALAIAGLPVSGGALAKLAIKGPLGGGMIGTMATLSAVGTALIMLRFLQVAGRGSRSSRLPGAWLMTFTWAATTLAALVLPWLLFERLSDLPRVSALTTASLWSGAWPILLALVVGALIMRATGGALPRVPQGDVVVLGEALARRLANVGSLLGARVSTLRAWLSARRVTVPLALIDRLERGLQSWSLSGSLALLLILTLAIALRLPG